MPARQLQDWEKLCHLASVECDPERLMALIREIDRLLAEKEQRQKKNARIPR